MATTTGYGQWLAKGVHLHTWTGLGGSLATKGTPFSAPTLPDKTVQVVGTSSGAVIAIQGTNGTATGTTASGWVTLNNPEHTALSFAGGAKTVEAILENPRFIRPILTTSGKAAANLTVYIVSQSTRR